MFATISRLFGSNLPPRPAASDALRPRLQSLYSFNHEQSAWLQKSLSNDLITSPSLEHRQLAVLTWNVDFASPFPILRLQSALEHLEQLLSPLINSSQMPPTIIFLQELDRGCIPTLLFNRFIRAVYDVTDISPVSWNSNHPYGTVSLVPKSLSAYVACVFRTPFRSSIMGRDALYIDFHFPEEGRLTKIRVANTHLESLAGHGDRARAQQLASISQFLSCHPLNGGLVGGDMNAISPSDLTLADSVGLADAWTSRPHPQPVDSEQAAPEDESNSYTWGYQPSTVFPPGRLDKILFIGDLRVDAMERIGVGLEHANADDSAREAWVSDHYGLLARFTIL